MPTLIVVDDPCNPVCVAYGETPPVIELRVGDGPGARRVRLSANQARQLAMALVTAATVAPDNH